MSQTYKATVSNRFLEKVDRVFDASPRTVFNELLQNARRAKATTVTVALDVTDGEPIITFEDDGVGMGDPEPLLNLAGSGWDGDTEALEDPAGMGFFCLSNFDEIKVHSRDWFALVSNAVFRGVASTTTQPMGFRRGTKVQWRWPGQSLGELNSCLRDAAEFCGLEQVDILLGGAPMGVTPRAFTSGLQCVSEFEEKGYTIAVHPQSGPTYYNPPAPSIDINFNGVRVTEQLPAACTALGVFRMTIRVDVHRVRDLQLVLPARNALKHNEGREEMIQLCVRKAYEWVAKHEYGDHHLPYKYYKLAQDEFGLDIGEAKEKYSAWIGENQMPADTKVIIPREFAEERPLRTLWRVHHDGGLSDFHAVTSDTNMEGYSWYDELLRLERVTVCIDGNELDAEDVFCDQDPDNDGPEVMTWADSLQVRFKLSDESEYEVEPHVFVAGAETHSDIDYLTASSRIYISKELQKNPELRAQISYDIFLSLFQEDYMNAEVPTEEQSDNFAAGVRVMLATFLGGEMEGVRCLLAEHLDNTPYDARDTWHTWTVRFNGRDRKEHGAGPNIVFLGTIEEEDKHHKIVATVPGGSDGAAYAMVSAKEITPDRVEAYLIEECEHDPDADGFILDAHGPTIDLDAWEASQPTDENE